MLYKRKSDVYFLFTNKLHLVDKKLLVLIFYLLILQFLFMRVLGMEKIYILNVNFYSEDSDFLC